MKIVSRSVYTDRLIGFLGKGVIVALTGQRRAGKSCVLREAMERLSRTDDAPNIVYVNKEFAEFNFIRNDADLNAYVESKLDGGRANYLFVDEVQEIENFQNSLRNFQAKGACEIAITGSNANMFSGELATHLTGRYVVIHVQTLSYCEFLEFHKLEESERSFRLFLQYGGLPQLAHIGLENAEMVNSYLNDIYSTVLLRDVVSRENVRNIRFLTDLNAFLADNVGKNISANSISKYMRGQGQNTSAALIANYLLYLSNAYIIQRAARYDIRGKRLFETNEKYYFTDVGLRNVMVGGPLAASVEKLLENVVYNELVGRGYKVYVGELQAGEVDFVALRGEEREYYQVCYMLSSEETREREVGALRKIKDSFGKYILTLDPLMRGELGDGIRVVNLREWLLLK